MTIEDDPRPLRPIEPDSGDCCGDGCVNCILDAHDAAMERYEAALAEWHKRHPGAVEDPTGSSRV